MKKLSSLLILMLLSISLGFSQVREFTGRVIVTGLDVPIPKASIRVTGDTKFKGNTNEKGEFTIPYAKGTFKIAVNMANFLPMEVEIPANAKEVVISLSLDPQFAGTVDQAFGTVSKKANSSPVTEVKLSKGAMNTYSSMLDMLRGTPGIEVRNGSITIRGLSSVNAQAEPLIVVDGSVFSGDINAINPSDVERINVLKDSSAAMYGARGAAGVIMITTKKK